MERDDLNAADWIARITALESDLATARAERDAAVAAGKILAAMFYRAKLMGYDRSWADEQINSIPNPLALAWVKAAQEASNGT